MTDPKRFWGPRNVRYYTGERWEEVCDDCHKEMTQP